MPGLPRELPVVGSEPDRLGRPLPRVDQYERIRLHRVRGEREESRTAMHCCRFVESPVSRRDMLLRCANGFGALAFTALGREPSFGAMLGDAPAEAGSAS